ncbi:MAG: cell wall-binding repeat-containing protein [Ruminococcus sp.]|nr:cell wall-binding repeat-containing protein [Ruminococcus sp.]
MKTALANSFSNIGAKPENTVVLFTGHSRGAAVANILAGVPLAQAYNAPILLTAKECMAKYLLLRHI